MTINSLTPDSKQHSDLIAGIRNRVVQILVMFIVMGLLLFLGSGRLDWKWAWIFLGISLLSVAINAVIMVRTSPATIAERGKPTEVKGWDMLISGIWLIGQYLLLPLLAALDQRFGWTGDLPLGWHILGGVIYAAGLGLTGWAMIVNAYFSTVVRIQSDRGQQVCRSGPYAFIRHPGYIGFFIQGLSVPILLGSLWALIFVIPAAICMIIRTTLEDRLLQAELAGYKDYAQVVKYRLIPGLW